MLTDEELLRYNRQLMLPQWDIAAQEKIRAAKVLIVGMGGVVMLIVLAVLMPIIQLNQLVS